MPGLVDFGKLNSSLVGLGRVGGLMGVVCGTIGAAVVDEAGLGVAWGSIAADLGTGSGIAVAALMLLLFGWAGAGVIGR